MHGLAVYLKKGLPFAQDLYLETSADSYLCFWLTLLISLSYFFFLYQTPSLSLLSNTDEVLSINPSANVFVLGDFNIHHKGWLTYSGGTYRSGVNSVIIFYNFFTISNYFTQLVNFPTWIPDCDSHRPALLDLFCSSDAIICSIQWLSFHWEILIILLSQIPLTFHHIHNGMPCFITLFTILMLVGTAFVIIWEIFHG